MTEARKDEEIVDCPECGGKGGWQYHEDAEMCQSCEGKGKVKKNMICPKEKCKCVLQFIEGSSEWVRYCACCEKVIHPKHYMKEEFLTQQYIDMWIEHMAYTVSGTLGRIEWQHQLCKAMSQAIATEHGSKPDAITKDKS